MISPIQSTIDVEPMIITQSEIRRGVTLKNSPPTVTMAICPTRIASAMATNPPAPLKWKALRPVWNARALNIFQNCRKTKIVKNIDSS